MIKYLDDNNERMINIRNILYVHNKMKNIEIFFVMIVYIIRKIKTLKSNN